MGATFSRLKNWIAEILNYSDLNAEIDNILSNLTPSGTDDYSTNATQMRTDTDGGESGTESLATSLAGEIERLRFAIREIKGSGVSYWYQSASTSLTEIASALGSTTLSNRIVSGRTRTGSSQPLFLVPNGAAASAILHASSTSFVHYIAGTQYTISANVSITGLTVAPSSNNTTLVNMPGVNDQSWTKMCGEYGSVITVDNMGSEITALTGKLAGFKHGAGPEYFIARVDSSTQLSQARRGFFFDSAGSPLPREVFADNDTITLQKLTWIFLTTGGTLTACYTNPTVSASQPTSPAFGDYWFDLTTATWKIYSLSATWDSAGAALIGITMQDTSNCVVARGFDFFKSHEATNTLKFVRDSATQVIAPNNDGEIRVYGTSLRYGPDRVTWSTATHFDSGVTEAASTLYFCYIKESGVPVISDIAPYDRTADLRGLYHPFQTWRCVGQVYNNSSSDFVAAIDYGDTSEKNMKIISQVAASALTLKLFANPLSKLALNSHNTTEIAQTIQIPCEINLVVSSGSTLGHASATQYPLNVYVLSSNKTPYLGVCSYMVGGGGTITSVAEGGAGAADSLTVLYTQGALSAVPGIHVASMASTQATAGTWAAVPTETALFPVKTGKVTIQKFTSGTSQTYTTPYGVSYLRVRMVGGGGGGGGSGSGAGSGSNGTASTFGSQLSAGQGGAGAFVGAAGGSASLGTGPVGTALTGGSGSGGGYATVYMAGGAGGNSFFGGGGIGGPGGAAGGNAAANTGGGGGGGGLGNVASQNSGGGGSSGAFIDALIFAPASSYTYTVGALGAKGAAGASGFAGGDGGSGYIEVWEYYE